MKNTHFFEASSICKNFGPTRALIDASLTLKPGEIHGLIGENGSGKSTLSSIIAGVQTANSGSLSFKGKPYNPTSLLDANQRGITILVQEQGTFENISVASNIFVGHESLFSKGGILSLRKMNAAARRILDGIGATHIDEKISTAAVAFEDRKLIELARAMYFKPQILIADETTTALNHGGRDLLYDAMKKLKDEGNSVIFISHDIDKIINVCDYLTVLRDGEIIDTLEKNTFEEQKIKQLMVGREVAENFYRKDSAATAGDDDALIAENISYGQLNKINMKVKKGEIVGIGGLTDCGMHDLGKILYGLIKPDLGSIKTGSGKVITNELAAIRHGIGYISKDRDKESLMLSASIRDNLCLPSLKNLSKGFLVFNKQEIDFSNQWVETLRIKMQDIDQHVMYLSGGNKQKVSISKWLGYDTEIFIFDCPTRGIDVGVKSAIYDLMMELKEAGKAIVMISEELSELIGMSDRIHIMKDGTLHGNFTRDENLTEHKLIEYMI